MAPAADDPSRAASPVDALAETYLDDSLSLDPFTATTLGMSGFDDRVTLYSPHVQDARAELARTTLRRLADLDVLDRTDEITAATLRDRLGVDLELDEAEQLTGRLDVIDSPPQLIRMAFDLAPTTTQQDWSHVATRMSALGESIDSYLEALDRRIADKRPPTRRQTAGVIAQCEQVLGVQGLGQQPHRHQAGPGQSTPEQQSAGAGSFFARFVAQARPDGVEPSPGLRRDLTRGVQAAQAAYARLIGHLRESVLPIADEHEAAGREIYHLWSRHFIGAAVDLEETYAWGQAELARVEAEMAQLADQITPGGSVADAVAALEADPARQLSDAHEFRDWMQRKADEAVTKLADTHFDIAEPIRRIECRIAPTTSGVVYYTSPSLDFTRPGRMWWAVPEGVETFSTWHELTTVYHEGVPGHHLQLAQTLYRADLLNRWRRLLFISGHGEGWALYAERFMADLGYLDDPGDRLGMLSASAFRATRVVVDIGLHCGFPAPAEVGCEWTPETMWQFMRRHVLMPEPQLRFEHSRYLGWPGQAPSYKVGERLWRQIRDDARAKDPDAFDLKTFHRDALNLGCVPLDVLGDQVLRDQVGGVQLS